MQLKNKKFFTINLGCRTNTYETNCVSNDLLLNKAIKAKNIKDADICIINTCSVTNKADAKSKYFINKVLRENPKILLVIMGCFSQTNPEYFSNFKNIIAIGNKYKNKIIDLIKNYDNKPIIKIDKFNTLKEFEKFSNISFIDNTRAFLKIQDGCNYMCSYCIIPFSRGPQRSLDHNEIIKEIKALSKSFYEIVLTGINIAGYLDKTGCDFYHLLKLINKIDGDFRIRISSIEPFQINKNIINLICNNPRFVQQFHLCLQSGSDDVLKLMNRKYTIKEFVNLVKYIRKLNPLASITTDYIVGFNHETDKYFNDSIKALKQIKFANMHIFPFSMRKFTAISRDKNLVNSSTIKNRFNVVSKLNQEIQSEYLKKFINKKVIVNFEHPSEKKIQEGYSQYFFKVYVNTCKPLQGQAREVIINKVVNNKCFGSLLF